MNFDILNAPGWYGKLPALGDFATRRLAASWVQSCDRWLSDCVAASQDQLGPRWLDVYLSAPVWRFAWAPGVVDHQWWFGVLMPSCDNVGRYFPLLVAQPRERPPLDRAGFEHLEAWWAHVARAALQTLHDRTSVDQFEDTLARAPAWPGTPPLAAGPAVAASGRYRHATADGASLAQVMQGIAAHELLGRLAGGSLWWPMGGAGGEGDHDPTITFAQGLPQPDQFAELLACGW